MRRVLASCLVFAACSVALPLVSAAPARGAPARLATGSDGAWSEVPPPVGREAMVYDPIRQRLIIVGGGQADNTAGVWVSPLTGSPQWTFAPTSGSRPPLGNVSVIYDSVRDRLVVLSLANTPQLWILGLSTMSWSVLPASGAPPSERFGQVAIFDPTRDRMVVFGGGLGLTMVTGPQYNDVWELTLGDAPAWNQLHPSGSLPMGRQYPGCIYDPVRDRMVIFGGAPDYSLTNYTNLNDVWALSLAGPAWVQLQPAGALPPAVVEPGALYDPVRDRLVISGGYEPNGFSTRQTWAMDLTSPAWNQLATTGSPIGGGRASTYDPSQDRLMSYSGGALIALALPTLTWSQVLRGAGSYAFAGYDFVLTLDADRAQMLDTGGLSNASDYWPSFANPFVADYSLTTGFWPRYLDLVSGVVRPNERADHSAVVDAARSRLIVFGGFEDDGGGGFYGNETRALALTGPVSWTLLAPGGTPPAGRAGQATIVDPTSDRMVIFGGTDGSRVLSDVWALGFAGPQWSPLAPTGTPPPPRQRAAAFYDPVGARMIVFGGFDKSGVDCCRLGTFNTFNDLWALSLTGAPAWTRLAPLGTPPPPTTDPIAVYDVDRARAVVLTDAGTWALTLGDPPQWTRLDIAGGVNGTIARGAAIDDPFGHRVLAMTPYAGILWSLDFSGPPTAVEVSVVRATALVGQASLEWATAPGLRATIERAGPDAAWGAIAEATADGRGRIAYADRGVHAGARYGYRLKFAEGGVARRAGEVWVDVPLAELALRGAVPNPAGADARISFSLPGPGAARLELLDLAGRRLAVREVGGLGPGSHAVALGPGRLAPGVYLVRLTREGRSLTTRIAVLR